MKDIILNIIQQNIYATIIIISIVILFLLYVLFKPSKKKNKTNEQSKNTDLDIVSKDKRLKAKSEAIRVLQNFSIGAINKTIDGQIKTISLSVNYPDNVSDYDIIMAFSRLSDENTSFTSDWSYPDGKAGENNATYIDGIIWGLVFAPEFIHQTISHKEFLKMWKDERERKLDMENFIRQIDIKDFFDKIIKRENDYILPVYQNDKQILYLDIDVFFQVFKETYEEYIYNKMKIKFANPFNFYQMFAMKYGYSHIFEMMQNILPLGINNTNKLLVKK